MKRKPKVEVFCSYCQKSKLVSFGEGQRYKNHFCNPQCKGKWDSENRKGPKAANWQGGDVTVSCSLCNKKYEISKYHQRLIEKRQSRNFCSFYCRDRYRSLYLIGKKAGHWKGGSVDSNCSNCGIDVKIKQFNIGKYNNNFCSKECKNEFYVGDRHYMWNGGSTYEPYTPEFNMDLKVRIRERDNYSCGVCGKDLRNDRIDIHHIDYDKKNSVENNLIALCVKCHLRTNFNRDYWKIFFKSKMGNQLSFAELRFLLRNKPIQANGGR